MQNIVVAASRVITFFCANIPYLSGDEELRHVFESVGYEVHRAQVVRDRVTNKSRGIGFVEVYTAQAAKVIEDVAGQKIRNREIRLEVSNSRKSMARDEERGHERR